METYEEIYQRMKENYTGESGEDFDEAGDIAIRLRVLAGEIYSMQTNLEWLKRQMFPSTATGEYLDYFAQQRGITRVPARKARGELIFSVAEPRPTSIYIPRGTVVSTDDENPQRFYTTEDSQIWPGTYATDVPAEAEEPGYRGNINIRMAVIPVSVPSEIDEVTNLSTFKGGTDAESDITLRARIQQSYLSQPNGMNAAYYIALAKTVDGIVKAGVIPKLRGAGTLNVYVTDTEGNVTDEQLAQVQQVLNDARELNVNVLAARGSAQDYDMNVTVTPKEGYTSAEITALCTDAFEDYVSTIEMGGKLYLTLLGKYLLESGCIKNYSFDSSMSDMTIPASKFFVTGDVRVEVVT